jgi:hypothetical protein
LNFEIEGKNESKSEARAKGKINFGKVDKTSRNPLDIFVNPEFRNTPNLEMHPTAKNFRGTLTELRAGVPRLMPTRTTLINMGANIGAEAGGNLAG